MSIKSLLSEAPARREYPAFEAGVYQAHVIDTGYVPTKKDAAVKQAMIKVQIDGGPQNGRWVNLYLSPASTDEQFARNLRPWVSILGGAGIPEDQIIDDESDADDVCLNLTTVIVKALRKGIQLPLEVVLKPDARTPGEFYRNAQPIGGAVSTSPALEQVEPNAAQLAAFAAASAPAATGF